MTQPTAQRNAPAAAMAAIFWLMLTIFVVADWLRTSPQRNRFDEPPPFAIGSGPAGGGGHCAAAPAQKR